MIALFSLVILCWIVFFGDDIADAGPISDPLTFIGLYIDYFLIRM